MLDGNGLERRELVDAGVVDQDIEPAIRLLGFGKEPLDVVRLGDIGLNGECFAALLLNAFDDGVRASLAACVIDYDRRALRRQMLGNGRSDSLGGSRNDSYFVLQLAHDFLLPA